MQNLDMRHFTTVQTAADNDYVILNLGTGLAAKISVGLLKNLLTAKISPNIVDGVWHVGTTSLDVSAEGKTPELRQGELGIEYKYTTEDDTSWKLLIPYTSIKLQYDMLTASQKDEMATLVSGQIAEDVYTRVSEDVVEEFTETINTAVEGANTAANNANTAATDAINAKNEAIAAKNNTVKAIQEAEIVTTEANKATQDALTATTSATKAAQDAIEATNASEKATEEAIKATNEAVQAKQDAEEATNRTNTATTSAIKAANDANAAKNEANLATKNAKEAALEANNAAEEANKYANRVKDITEAQWEEMEENKTWVEGVEYNVYESAEEEEVVEDEV